MKSAVRGAQADSDGTQAHSGEVAMAEISPRYEFRAFAQNFGMVETKMRRLAKCEQIRESSEIYIVSAANSENNTKIRDGKMDIKVFVEKREGLEQWNPRMKGEFPMKTELLRREVFPAFGVAEPDFRREEYGLQECLDEIIFPHPQLTAVDVVKLRFAFTVNGCIAEIAQLLINGAAIRTVAVEHTDIGAILKAREMLGLQEYENVNYLRAIKRIIGLERLPV
ncbi:MAG: hypothetical protein V1798_03110 [Pseudomonadota bacterium]